jgi:hypothetical protein
MISIVEEVGLKLNINHTFMGLTIGCWGGNISGFYIK